MRVRVLYFGVLKDEAGREREAMELPEGSSVATLVALVRGRGDDQRRGLWGSIAVAVNGEYVRGDALLQDGDEVALLPPVSGGRAEDGVPCR